MSHCQLTNGQTDIRTYRADIAAMKKKPIWYLQDKPVNRLIIIIRYPNPVSPWLNLVNLMTPTSWAWTLASLATVALCFNVASLVVRRWMGMRLENIEIDLWPFR